MIRAFGLAFSQLFDARLLRVVLLSLVVTIAIYAAMLFGLGWALNQITIIETPWLNTLARWGSGIGAALLASLMFPSVVTAVMGIWQDDVAEAVEARHYPHLPPARKVPLRETLGSGARLVLVSLLLNAAMLPLYAVLLFVPPANAVAFVLVNGLLLGREYFDTSALRRLPADEAARLRRAKRGAVWGAGIATALVLTVPGLNLLGPVIATAAFVHLAHGWARQGLIKS